MKTPHTPGPWFLGSDSDFIFDSNDTDANIVCGFFGKYEQDFENKEANAKLIAAAPEMLEALIELIPFASEWINDNHPAMQKAKSAIKKATE